MLWQKVAVVFPLKTRCKVSDFVRYEQINQRIISASGIKNFPAGEERQNPGGLF